MTVSTMLDFISTRDHRLMRKLNKWPAPKWVRLWAIAATRAGDGWLWYAIGLLVLLFGGSSRWLALGAAGSAAGVGAAAFSSIKRLSGRKRPCDIEPHCWATLLPPDQFSFPSGHTITAFAVAVTFGIFYPVLFPFLLFCAFSIALSRIVLGMHFLSDVIAGATLGIILAISFYQIFCISFE
jgi:undecaprenyl-diphosphatase